MKAAAYIRVSTARQGGADHFSLPVQRDLFHARCTERGYVVGPEYVDTETGRKASRKGYQALLADARRGVFDVVVVRAIDRLGRDADELTVRMAELRQLGVKVEAIHTIVPSESEPSIRRLLEGIEAFLAQNESEKISARVKGTMAASARAGNWQGGPAPYGYALKDKRLVVEPFEAEVVRGVFAAYVTGNRSMIQIARDLNLRDVPSRHRKPWVASAVGVMLHRLAYTGDLEWGGVVVPGACPALVDKTTYEAAQHRAAVKRTLPAGRTQTSAYLLSGLIFCGKCQGRMLGHRSDNSGTYRDRAQRGYVCQRHRLHGSCTLNYHDADHLEADVLERVTAWAGDIQKRHQGLQDEAERLSGLLAGVDARLAGIPSRYAEAFRLYERGRDESAFHHTNESISADQRDLEAQRSELTRRLEAARLSVESVSTVASMGPYVAVAFEGLDLPARKGLLQQLVERIDCQRGESARVLMRI